MPKINHTRLLRSKTAQGEVLARKTAGGVWYRPSIDPATMSSPNAWPELGSTITITKGTINGVIVPGVLTLDGVDVTGDATDNGITLDYVVPVGGSAKRTLTWTPESGLPVSMTVYPALANLPNVTVAIDAGTPYAGTASDVKSISAGGSRALVLNQMDAANAVKITKTATGFRFNGGNWLRANHVATPVGKILMLARLCPFRHTGKDGSLVASNAMDINVIPTGLRWGGVLGGNFNVNISPIKDFGQESVMAFLVDYDAGVATHWEDDGKEVVTTRTAASMTQTQYNLGRFSDAELRELIVIEVGVGQPLPISGFDAWRQMTQSNLVLPTTAEVMGGFGQSLWQAQPVPVSPPEIRKVRNYQARMHALAVNGIRRQADNALIYEIGNGGNLLDYSITAEAVTLRPLRINNGETILFSAVRWLRDYRSAAGLPTPALIAGTNGLGGQGIDEFDDDPSTGTTQTTLWTNNQYWFTTAYNRGVIEYGSADIRYFGVVHGTADKVASLGEYYTDFIRATELHLNHCENLSGTRPKLWMTQSGGDTDSSNGDVWAVCLDQLALVDHYDAIFVGPLYPNLIFDDNVHPDYIQHSFMGELVAIKVVAHEQGVNLNALSASAVWAGDNLSVVLTYPAPDGCTVIGPHDTTKYAAYGGFMSNYGFDSDGTISGVSFAGNQITVTFSTPATWLTYAMQVQNVKGNTDIDGRGYTAHRGVLAWDWEHESLAVPSQTHRLWLPSDRWVAA